MAVRRLQEVLNEETSNLLGGFGPPKNRDYLARTQAQFWEESIVDMVIGLSVLGFRKIQRLTQTADYGFPWAVHSHSMEGSDGRASRKSTTVGALQIQRCTASAVSLGFVLKHSLA
jgi:hypothetical protein